MENIDQQWPPAQIVPVEDGLIEIENATSGPFSITRDVHVINVIRVYTKLISEIINETSQLNLCSSTSQDAILQDSSRLNKIAVNNASSIDISIAPSQLQAKLKQAHIQYADVFAPDLTVGYNGKSGEHFGRLQFVDDNRPQMSKCHIQSGQAKMIKSNRRKWMT